MKYRRLIGLQTGTNCNITFRLNKKIEQVNLQRQIEGPKGHEMSEVQKKEDGPVMKTEDLFESDLLYELLLSQKEAARFLELAYLILKDDPEISKQVRDSADDAQNQHLRTHGLVREYQVTALHVVKTMLPLIEVGVKKKKVDLVKGGLDKVLTYVNDMIKKTKDTKDEYYKIKGQINSEITKIDAKNRSIKDRESAISAKMMEEKLQIEKEKKEMEVIKTESKRIEEELKELKKKRQEFLEKSVQTDKDKARESIISGILTAKMAAIGTLAAGPVGGVVLMSGATAVNYMRIKQTSDQAVKASEKTKEDIHTEQNRVDENEERLAKMRERAIQSLVAMEKLALENANQMNEESLKIAGEELGRVVNLFAKILLFWEDFSAKLTALSNSQDALKQFIEYIHNPELAEDIDESVGQVKKMWNSFGIMCTCYVNESTKQLNDLYAFMSHPVDYMAVEECNKRKREILETHRAEIKELEKKIM